MLRQSAEHGLTPAVGLTEVTEGAGVTVGVAEPVEIPVGVPPVASTRQIERNVLISAAPVGFAST